MDYLRREATTQHTARRRLGASGGDTCSPAVFDCLPTALTTTTTLVFLSPRHRHTRWQGLSPIATPTRRHCCRRHHRQI